MYYEKNKTRNVFDPGSAASYANSTYSQSKQTILKKVDGNGFSDDKK